MVIDARIAFIFVRWSLFLKEALVKTRTGERSTEIACRITHSACGQIFYARKKAIKIRGSCRSQTFLKAENLLIELHQSCKLRLYRLCSSNHKANRRGELRAIDVGSVANVAHRTVQGKKLDWSTWSTFAVIRRPGSLQSQWNMLIRTLELGLFSQIRGMTAVATWWQIHEQAVFFIKKNRIKAVKQILSLRKLLPRPGMSNLITKGKLSRRGMGKINPVPNTVTINPLDTKYISTILAWLQYAPRRDRLFPELLAVTSLSGILGAQTSTSPPPPTYTWSWMLWSKIQKSTKVSLYIKIVRFWVWASSNMFSLC